MGIYIEDAIGATLKLDGVGDTNMNVDGGATPFDPKFFFFEVPLGFHLTVFAVSYQLIGSASFAADGFADDKDPLFNGTLVEVVGPPPDSVARTILNIRKNGDFALLGPVFDTGENRGLGCFQNIAGITGGEGIVLKAGSRIRATVRDDLTNILDWRIMVRGRIDHDSGRDL